MILTLDRVQGSSYDSNIQQTIIYRGFVATELPTNQPADVIRQAIVGAGGMPQLNTPHPTQQGCYVVGYNIRLIGDSQADGFVKYSGATFINQWYFSRHSYLQSIETEIDPVYPAPSGGEPIHVNVDGGAGTTNAIYGLDETGQLGSVIGYYQGSNQSGHLPYLRPMAVFKATGIFTSPPGASAQAAFGCVNSDSVYLNLGAGYWLCNDISFSTEDLGTTFAVQVQMISLVNENWSSTLVGKDLLGNAKYINPTVTTALKNSVYTTTPNYQNNITRYGLYNAVPFKSAFNFNQSQLAKFDFLRI